MKRRLHVNEKNLTLWVEEEGRQIYFIQCINLVHYYAVRYTLEQKLRGKITEHELLIPLKGLENGQQTNRSC